MHETPQSLRSALFVLFEQTLPSGVQRFLRDRSPDADHSAIEIEYLTVHYGIPIVVHLRDAETGEQRRINLPWAYAVGDEDGIARDHASWLELQAEAARRVAESDAQARMQQRVLAIRQVRELLDVNPDIRDDVGALLREPRTEKPDEA